MTASPVTRAPVAPAPVTRAVVRGVGHYLPENVVPNSAFAKTLDTYGLDGAAILEAGTRAPAAWFGLTDLGSLQTGSQASLLVLDADPSDAATLRDRIDFIEESIRTRMLW